MEANPTTATKPEPGLVRLILSRQASEALDAAGADAFAIVHRVMRTEEPENAGRWCIHLAPISHGRASAACSVLVGTHRAAKIKVAPDKES